MGFETEAFRLEHLYLKAKIKFQECHLSSSITKMFVLGAYGKLLDLSCLSVQLSVWNNLAPTGYIFMKFDI